MEERKILNASLNNYSAGRFGNIRHLIEKPIDITKLPVAGEGFYKKQTGDKYGHIIIKIGLASEVVMDGFDYYSQYSFAWLVDEQTIPYAYFKSNIEPVLIELAFLLTYFKCCDTPICFSIIGGSFRFNERPNSFITATSLALEDALRKLRES